ncbi:hypothetical protein [Gynuella sunshinyii]|uniref:Uncharacterized protein n=1 Tax=Gynuella sunshinyii YC6258 TaxID=1445510 RepID=A0A0C5VJ39_9GAMM|nr:hypothetical protein [Gynuella sunshinyii]AJQ94256.1 hypothetical Protein YC6258_02218 [Gynuella sunshinyii YC6258]
MKKAYLLIIFMFSVYTYAENDDREYIYQSINKPADFYFIFRNNSTQYIDVSTDNHECKTTKKGFCIQNRAFELFIPEQFKSISKWEYNGYEYSRGMIKKLNILGKHFEGYEISRHIKNGEIKFFYTEKYGLIYFGIENNGHMQSLFISSLNCGLFALNSCDD